MAKSHPNKHTIATLIGVVTLTLALCIASADALSVNIAAGAHECFYEELSPNQGVHFDFRVLSGGVLDIDVKVTSPDGDVLYEGQRENHGNVMFRADTEGDYDFCFSNEMSTVADKVIGFDIVADRKPQPHENLADDAQIDSIDQSIQRVLEGVSAIYSEQTYLRARERIHRETAESSDSKMFWYSVFEVVILAVMSIWQVMTLRKLFDIKIRL
eukprot:TRINITY_DN1674_c0_g1_i1.p1 TRINITY_DN1674_c0_g1~~TRINITY_DN1674_c0_g1_i1.p1  ORF type:complete len:214 (+),score=54.74 TRINITY_DN1674_c0_g1_i1:52-693(+)